MDLRDYYDEHWTHVPEGGVDYTRLQYVLDGLQPGERVIVSNIQKIGDGAPVKPAA